MIRLIILRHLEILAEFHKVFFLQLNGFFHLGCVRDASQILQVYTAESTIAIIIIKHKHGVGNVNEAVKRSMFSNPKGDRIHPEVMRRWHVEACEGQEGRKWGLVGVRRKSAHRSHIQEEGCDKVDMIASRKNHTNTCRAEGYVTPHADVPPIPDVTKEKKC